MRMPKSIYESYPVLYILFGISAISQAQSFLLLVSGLSLSLGGVAVLTMRRNYRLAKQHLVGPIEYSASLSHSQH